MIQALQLDDPIVSVEDIKKFKLAFLMQFFVQHKQRFRFPRLRLQASLPYWLVYYYLGVMPFNPIRFQLSHQFVVVTDTLDIIFVHSTLSFRYLIAHTLFMGSNAYPFCRSNL